MSPDMNKEDYKAVIHKFLGFLHNKGIDLCDVEASMVFYWPSDIIDAFIRSLEEKGEL